MGGAFYGLITLLTLREIGDGALPCGTLNDAPRFEWRGFMLDCVREYYPGAEPRGGSYAPDIVGQIFEHARRLNIEVMPEIEVPAHALALTTIYPDLRDPDDIGAEVSVQGYERNVVNPGQEATWDRLVPLALDVAEMFPFKHIHLGGDELPEGTWAGSKVADKYKQKHGLTTHQDVEGHVLNRLAGRLSEAGFTSCAWQEAGDGSVGIGHDAILFSWTGSGPGLRAISRGYRVVMCPAQHTYFDMAHSMDPDDWGANWAANFALDETINWDPIPSGAEGMEDKIIGVEGTFWSEFTSDFSQVEPMVAPRILGLATMAWSARGAVDLAHLRASATCYMPLFERIGWAAHGGAIMMDTPPEARRRSDDPK